MVVRTAVGDTRRHPHTTASRAIPISSVEARAAGHHATGVGEFDRVLGGGLVPGSVTLLAGDPGVGKSTLLLTVAHHWARSGRRALYVSAEESAGQIRMRADRIGCSHDEVYLAAVSDLHLVLEQIAAVQPTLVVVDSVQTISTAEADGVPGGVTQVRAVTAALTRAAKPTGVALILVGHVTKDGAIAGPRSLEHLVDVVLHFEGDRHSGLRMVRGVKNRFGTADEVGCFLLHDSGIEGVAEPYGLFVDQRRAPVAGTAITVALEGKRPLVGEVQALLAAPSGQSARRAVSGIDHARAAMIAAVLEKHAGLAVAANDIYLSTVGGMRLTDPSADLAVAIALSSAYANLPVPTAAVMIGEVGLAGDLRPVTGMERRLGEAARQGFTTAVIPPGCRGGPPGLRALVATTIVAALQHLLDIAGRPGPPTPPLRLGAPPLQDTDA